MFSEISYTRHLVTQHFAAIDVPADPDGAYRKDLRRHARSPNYRDICSTFARLSSAGGICRGPIHDIVYMPGTGRNPFLIEIKQGSGLRSSSHPPMNERNLAAPPFLGIAVSTTRGNSLRFRM